MGLILLVEFGLPTSSKVVAGSYPIFVLCLSPAPELQARHPEFGQASRNQTTLFLDRLSSRRWTPPRRACAVRQRFRSRSSRAGSVEGVPPVARCSETVRMLLDRGPLFAEAYLVPTGQTGPTYRGGSSKSRRPCRPDRFRHGRTRAGDDACSRTPPCSERRSRRKLCAARVGPGTAHAAARVAGLQGGHRKNQADPRSPERVAVRVPPVTLVRRVAYDTLRAQRSYGRPGTWRPRAVSEESFSARKVEQEVVEVVQPITWRACRGAPDADDAQSQSGRAPEPPLAQESGRDHWPLAARRGSTVASGCLPDEPLETAPLERVAMATDRRGALTRRRACVLRRAGSDS